MAAIISLSMKQLNMQSYKWKRDGFSAANGNGNGKPTYIRTLVTPRTSCTVSRSRGCSFPWLWRCPGEYEHLTQTKVGQNIHQLWSLAETVEGVLVRTRHDMVAHETRGPWCKAMAYRKSVRASTDRQEGMHRVNEMESKQRDGGFTYTCTNHAPRSLCQWDRNDSLTESQSYHRLTLTTCVQMVSESLQGWDKPHLSRRGQHLDRKPKKLGHWAAACRRLDWEGTSCLHRVGSKQREIQVPGTSSIEY